MPDADRVCMVRENNWDCLRRLSGGLDQGRRTREDYVDGHADQLGCESGQLVDPIRPAEFYDDVLTLDVGSASTRVA